MIEGTPLPPLPFPEWKESKDTLHLYLQIVGKIRLALSPRVNHWWHVAFYVTPRGLTTGPIPYRLGDFTVDFDFADHALLITTSEGGRRGFALRDGLAVADFYRTLREDLAALDIQVKMLPRPYDTISVIPFKSDTQHASYDREFVSRLGRVLVVAVDGVFQEFRGRFTGKSSPIHVFWHSFDLALTRFSGRPAPEREGSTPVAREAYSHECISFGFWAGDDRTPLPAFYSYTAPEPPGLGAEPLQPAAAAWNPAGSGVLAVLAYDEVRKASAPRETLLAFLESAYDAGAKRAGWDREGLALRPLA
jgi:hypothetical protein